MKEKIIHHYVIHIIFHYLRPIQKQTRVPLFSELTSHWS